MPDTAVVPAGDDKKPDLFKFKENDDTGKVAAKAASSLGGSTGGTIRASAFVKKLQAKARKKNNDVKKMLIAFIPLFLLVGLAALILSLLELPNERANAIANNILHDTLYDMNADLVSRAKTMRHADNFGLVLRHTTGIENSSMYYNVTRAYCGKTIAENVRHLNNQLPPPPSKLLYVKTFPTFPPPLQTHNISKFTSINIMAPTDVLRYVVVSKSNYVLVPSLSFHLISPHTMIRYICVNITSQIRNFQKSTPNSKLANVKRSQTRMHLL